MKKYSSFILTFLLFTPSILNAATYIGDQLFTYMHSGPSAQFRIIGSVNAGSEIKLLQNNKNSGYSKIVDPKGRSGWIETKFITKETPAILRLPMIEQELSAAKEELKTIADKNKALLSDIQNSLSNQITTNNQLLSERQKLKTTIQELQLNNNELKNRIANQSQEVERQWVITGAGIILLGIFIGLIVPHLPRRKKKNDTWA